MKNTETNYSHILLIDMYSISKVLKLPFFKKVKEGKYLSKIFPTKN